MTTPRAPNISVVNQLLDRTVLPAMLTFTRLGYRLRAGSGHPMTERLEGRRVLITGVTSGLGLASARALAQLGASLVLVGRDAEKMEGVAEDIGRIGGAVLPHIEIADLSLLSEVRALAARLVESQQPIHVLINNAGALFPHRSVTAEGHEMSLALNLLSPYLLTELLKPLLMQSAPARVINVSSGGMYTTGIDVDDLQSEAGEYNGAAAYARAKRGQVMLTKRWAIELADHNVTVHAMHPGWADTPGVRTALPGFFKVTRRVLRSPEEGADTITWLAAARDGATTTGGFWLDRQPHLTHVLPGTRAGAEDRQRLWDALKQLTGT